MKEQGENEWEEDREALLETFWLCSVRGIGPVSVRRLVEAAGGATRVKDLSRKTLEEVLGAARADALERGRQEKQRLVLQRGKNGSKIGLVKMVSR